MSNFTPAWFKKGFFNESLFCDDFLSTHQLLYVNGAFFTPDGRMTDTMPLRCEIFEMMREYVGANLAKKVTNVVDVLKLAAQVEDFPPVTDRIALANGTLYLDGTFQEGKPEIVRNRLPVRYDPKAPQPTHWLRFLSDLLYPEDIPTVQEFIGYCLIPSNKGQRMMVIKGSGGEGKSQIGVVLSRLFGCNMKDGSIGKISENRFARADLEHTLLCVDDDMRMEALRQTNYVKSIVTAQGQITFDAACRKMLFEIAKRHGLDLEEEAEYGNRKYLEKQDFILAKQKEQLAAQQSKLDELTLKVNDMETLIDEVATVAYDKAVEVVTDVVRAETRKEDMRMIEDTKKWVLSPERKAPQVTREYTAHWLDSVLDKFLKTMQTTAAHLQEKLLKPEVRQKGKEQVKEKARDSVLQLLSRLQAEQTQQKLSAPPTTEKSETRGDVY